MTTVNSLIFSRERTIESPCQPTISRWFVIGMLVVCCCFLVVPATAADADTPLPADEAARTMRVPDGFSVTTFAAEPDVMQPIGFCIDDRGRLWVAEAYNYPHHGDTPGDRLVILEDVDGDGRFDRRKVFYDQLNYVTGVEVGFGGVWVMSPPYFYFIPDRDGDDVPDSKPKVLLDGFGNHANSHNLANGLAWGPDGWLYGTHGRTNWSLVGKPGTPDDQRIRFDGGVYRYHPVRHVWEPYADGTTNPWGIDWNDYGDAFVCNCVNPHLFHVIPGAHYEPWRNRKSSQYAYERIDTIADHLHFVGIQNVRDGLGSSAEDQAGGGHAHCGMMIYRGDNWPQQYRNTAFLNNVHGRRINNDILHRKGSGYSATHGRDVMRCEDPWFMGVTLQYGPDGAVYVSDWSDTGECHSVRNTQRQTGRIYKICYGKPIHRSVDISAADNEQLANWQLHANNWYVQHARRVLQERHAAGASMVAVTNQLQRMFVTQKQTPQKLRTLWALSVMGGADDNFLTDLLRTPDPYVQAWAIRLLCEDGTAPKKALSLFREIATAGSSPYVRLYLTSALMRLQPADQWSILPALLARGEDNQDANLPKMYWYATHPLINDAPDRFVQLLRTTKVSLVQRFIARRVAVESDMALELNQIIQWLATASPSRASEEVLAGLLNGFEGRRTVKMPPSWPATFRALEKRDDDEIHNLAIRLALIFDDPLALTILQATVEDLKLPSRDRQRALQSLIGKRVTDLPSLLNTLLSDPAMQRLALQGLAEYNDKTTPQWIVSAYNQLPPTARQDALQTLASRATWAMDMLDAVDAKRIPRSDLSAYTARQLRNLGDQQVLKRVQDTWGKVRVTPEEQKQQIANYKKQLSEKVIDRGDLAKGRALYEKKCANCHRIFGQGGNIGPDLTGAQRSNIDYLLENLVDPSSAVSRDYQMEVLSTDAGRVVTGLIVAETPQAVTIQTVNERLIIPKSEVDERQKSSVSMMPTGLLNELSKDEIRDLVAFLKRGGP
ncbi:MAG TPA: c-type cytochrome [Planctomycetaceae bacterium]|nr:c-type cytochrome [Planctomycetaceae bacterium]